MKKILFVFLMAFSCLSTWAQKLTVSGTVTDQAGPLVGVTIKVQGLNTGAVTDLDGHYTISAPKNATIVYSYVGYNTVSKKVKDDAPPEHTDAGDGERCRRGGGDSYWH